MKYPRHCTASGMFVFNDVPSFNELWRKGIYGFRQRVDNSLNKVVSSVVNTSLLRSQLRKHWRTVGETGASCYRGRLLQGHFMQNYHIDAEIAYRSSILIHQRNHWRNKTIDARELFEIWKTITFDIPETCLRIFTTFLLVQSIAKNCL